LETGDLEQALEKAYAAVVLLSEMCSGRPGHAPAQYGKALEVLARCQCAREDRPGLYRLRRAIRELGPHHERHPAALQTVMLKVVASLRSLAPASVAEEVSPTILNLSDRHPASFVPPRVAQGALILVRRRPRMLAIRVAHVPTSTDTASHCLACTTDILLS
jgi:hypothetical protein